MKDILHLDKQSFASAAESDYSKNHFLQSHNFMLWKQMLMIYIYVTYKQVS